jgi:hypothetical protein
VRRVAPPTIKVKKIIAAAASSHNRTARGRNSATDGASCMERLLFRMRADHIARRAAPQQRRQRAAMPIRVRKLIGTVALLLLVMIWGLFAMALAQSVLTDINGFVAAIFYVVAGLGWVLPAMPLVSWMLRPDAPRPETRPR